ncbi:hypothetical protein HaLaN_06991 [Haematococcus lacustris]|uniref:Uncharacterized protein n=1 Tax=Haematococcus lacustris TaxID=44745 RepID=A0A699YMI0_HAELA|nr:hypothetical protein HaLaN_06991 [Haematococcus lacustris]
MQTGYVAGGYHVCSISASPPGGVVHTTGEGVHLAWTRSRVQADLRLRLSRGRLSLPLLKPIPLIHRRPFQRRATSAVDRATQPERAAALRLGYSTRQRQSATAATCTATCATGPCRLYPPNPGLAGLDWAWLGRQSNSTAQWDVALGRLHNGECSARMTRPGHRTCTCVWKMYGVKS